MGVVCWACHPTMHGLAPHSQTDLFVSNNTHVSWTFMIGSSTVFVGVR